MERKVKATEARVHFGELMKRAVDQGETIIVERAGVPQVVIMPVKEFEKLKARREAKGRPLALQRALQLRAGIQKRRERDGRRGPFPDMSDLLEELRDERDAEIIDGVS
jgi:prevent-host-death family protein